MTFLFDFIARLLTQFQSPTLGFLIGGMVIAACGSKLKISNAVYQFIVFVLLMKIGIKGGIEIRGADLMSMLPAAISAMFLGVVIVLLGTFLFSLMPGIKREDGIATAGIFGAVSASTLSAAVVMLDDSGIQFEAWAPALYPFMDIAALILAIVLANLYLHKQDNANNSDVNIWGFIKDSMRGSALSALILGLALGLFTNSTGVLKSFYAPLFSGFLSVLMLVMGMEAYTRLNELRRVAHWYAVYAFIAPIIHGSLAFFLGYVMHTFVGFSPGGVIILSVIAASNSDISGPPTLRSGIPSANPSAYIGASTSVGTPVAIVLCIPLFTALGQWVFNI